MSDGKDFNIEYRKDTLITLRINLIVNFESYFLLMKPIGWIFD